MTNEDLKRFYESNKDSTLAHDFARYDNAGKLQSANAVSAKDVVNLETLLAYLGGGELETLNYKGVWVSEDEIFTNDLVYVDRNNSRQYYVATSDIAESTIAPDEDTANWSELFDTFIIASTTISNVPVSATSGTLSESQLQLLQANDNNTLVFNNETFRLSDKKLSDGYIVYSHCGEDSAHTFYFKCITVTLSTRGWVLTTRTL